MSFIFDLEQIPKVCSTCNFPISGSNEIECCANSYYFQNCCLRLT